MRLLLSAPVILLAIALAAPTASGAPRSKASQEGVDLVEETTTKVLTLIASDEYQDVTKRKALRKKVLDMLLDVTEVDLVCQLTLGAKRREFNPTQYEAFKTQFSQLVFSTYITHLEKYTDQEITIVNALDTGTDRVKVVTRVLSSGSRIPVEYSLIKRGGKWLMYDVSIEGISLVRNYRTQFSTLLRKHKIDPFIDQVKQKVDKIKKEQADKLAKEAKAKGKALPK